MDGEITVDTTDRTVVVHDQQTAGGFPLARADLSNVSDDVLSSRICDMGTGVVDVATTDVFGTVKLAEIGDITSENCVVTSAGLGNAISNLVGVNLNNVPDEDWNALFAKFGLAPMRFKQSSEIEMFAGSAMAHIFGVRGSLFQDINRVRADAILVCKTAEGGYEAGDRCYTFGVRIDTTTNVNLAPNVMVRSDSLGDYIQLNIGPASGANTGLIGQLRDGPGVFNITLNKWRLVFRVWY